MSLRRTVSGKVYLLITLPPSPYHFSKILKTGALAKSGRHFVRKILKGKELRIKILKTKELVGRFKRICFRQGPFFGEIPRPAGKGAGHRSDVLLSSDTFTFACRPPPDHRNIRIEILGQAVWAKSRRRFPLWELVGAAVFRRNETCPAKAVGSGDPSPPEERLRSG
jgi:hypothetical protein